MTQRLPLLEPTGLRWVSAIGSLSAGQFLSEQVTKLPVGFQAQQFA